MKDRRMRLLREKHGLSLAELSRRGDITIRRLSQIELDAAPATPQIWRRVETAFSLLIAERRKALAALPDCLMLS